RHRPERTGVKRNVYGSAYFLRRRGRARFSNAFTAHYQSGSGKRRTRPPRQAELLAHSQRQGSNCRARVAQPRRVSCDPTTSVSTDPPLITAQPCAKTRSLYSPIASHYFTLRNFSDLKNRVISRRCTVAAG